MKLTTLFGSLAAAAVLAGALAFNAAPAQAQNIVTNGSFETGNFSGWTQSGNTGATGVETAGFDGWTPEQGTYFAALGPVGSIGYLTQDLTTTPGQAYLLTFYEGSDGDTPNNFDYTFGGPGETYSITNQPRTEPLYLTYTDTYVATSTSTELQFSFQNNPGYQALDNISVVAVNGTVTPEPSSMAAFGIAGLGLLGLAAFARKRSMVKSL